MSSLAELSYILVLQGYSTWTQICPQDPNPMGQSKLKSGEIRATMKGSPEPLEHPNKDWQSGSLPRRGDVSVES